MVQAGIHTTATATATAARSATAQGQRRGGGATSGTADPGSVGSVVMDMSGVLYPRTRRYAAAHGRDRLPQPLLPAGVPRRAALRQHQRAGHRRRRRQPAPALPRRLQRRRPRPSRHRIPRGGVAGAGGRHPGAQPDHSRDPRGVAAAGGAAGQPGQRRLRHGGPRQARALRRARHAAAQRPRRGGARARARLYPARLPRRHAVQQRQRRGAVRRALLAAVRGGGRPRRGAPRPPHQPGGRRGDDRVLADAAGGLPVRHHARRGPAGVQRRRRALPPHPLGAGPPGRRHPVPGRAARPRVPRLPRVPRPSHPAAERGPEALLLRHGELRSRRAGAGRGLRRRRPPPRRQRLPAPDRQHPEDAGLDPRAAGLRPRARRRPRRQRRAPAAGLAIVPAPAGVMTLPIFLVLALLVAVAICFALEKISVDIITLLLLCALVLLRLLPIREAFAGFSSDIVIVLAALFVLSGALIKTGVMENFGSAISKIAGTSRTRVLLVLMPATACIAAFLHNTTTTAVFLPAVLGLCKKSRLSPSQILIPFAFASMMGGTCTLLASSTTIAASGYMASAGLRPIGLFEL